MAEQSDTLSNVVTIDGSYLEGVSFRWRKELLGMGIWQRIFYRRGWISRSSISASSTCLTDSCLELYCPRSLDRCQYVFTFISGWTDSPQFNCLECSARHSDTSREDPCGSRERRTTAATSDWHSTFDTTIRSETLQRKHRRHRNQFHTEKTPRWKLPSWYENRRVKSRLFSDRLGKVRLN